MVNPWAIGFGETFAGLPVEILQRLKVYIISKTDSPFTISFESKEGSSYGIEASHDLKEWGKIGEVKGTGVKVKFTYSRLDAVPFERIYFRVKLLPLEVIRVIGAAKNDE